MIITIDGPTASGKSTIARMLAQKLGWRCLNSGLLFRAVAYILTTKFNVNPDNLSHLTTTDIEQALDPKRFIYTLDMKGGHISFDGVDITSHLENASIDQIASKVATNEYVRERIKEEQRRVVKDLDAVVEGRDCGSVVFPKAEIKFFLTASVEIRAHRWEREQEERGVSFEKNKAQQLIKEKDERDTKRDISPLVVPAGAYIIDSSAMDQNQTVEYMLSFIHKKG